MRTRFLQLLLSGALATSGALVPKAAQACGGFFCSATQQVNQAAERIVFATNGDGTVTAVIEIMYQGPAETFSWLLPISSVPKGDQIAVASNLAFQRLQQATNPQYVSVRSRPFLTYGGRAAQFCGKSSSTRSAEVESSRIKTSVKYASGSSSWATQVATTV